MENKKTGLVIIVLSLLVGAILFVAIEELRQAGEQLGCFPTEDCEIVESSLGLAHIAVGAVSFFVALGFYMVLFNKGEEAILRRLEQEKNKTLKESKFDIMLKMLDLNEQRVLKAIRDQDGITQASLVLRTGLSKSMVSEILTSFETKNLIKRETDGRTKRVRLIESV